MFDKLVDFKIFNWIIFLVVIKILLSCSSENAKLPQQQNADAGRTNSYEHVEFFHNSRHYTTEIRIKDKSGCIQQPIALPDGRFVVATKNYALNLISSTEKIWTVFPDTNLAIASAMAVDKDENIFVLLENGRLIQYAKDGKLMMIIQNPDSVAEFETFSDILLQNDGIVIGSNRGVLKKYDFKGKLLWHKRTNLNIPKTFCSDENNNIYMMLNTYNVNDGDSLIAFDKSGNIKWLYNMKAMTGSKSVVYKNGKIYTAFQKFALTGSVSELICLDVNGKKLWSKQLPIPIRNISVDKQENVIVSGYNPGTGEGISGIFSLKQGGNVNWSQYLKATINAPMLLSNTDIAITAMTPQGAGTFILDKSNGNLKRHVSMNDAPILYLSPCVSSEGNLTYFGIDKLQIITIVSSSVL